jgi:hypothetical protein
MHNREAEIVDLVGEHLQIKEKTKIGGRWYERRVKKEKERRISIF